MNINTLTRMAFFTQCKRRAAVVHAGGYHGDTRRVGLHAVGYKFGCVRSLIGVFSVIFVTFSTFRLFGGLGFNAVRTTVKAMRCRILRLIDHVYMPCKHAKPFSHAK